MSKKHKIQLGIIWTCIIALAAIIIIYVASFVIDYVKLQENSKKIVTEFNEIYESSERKVVLFAASYCHFCQEFKPLLEEIAKENNFEFYYFDAGSVVKDEMNNIIDKLDLGINGVPHLAVIENKKLVGEQSGKRDKETTIKFLKETGIIKEEVSE